MNKRKYNPPSDPLVANIVSRLDAEALERFEERAGIIAEGCSLGRGHSEALALLDLLLQQPWWLTGLIALQVEAEGRTNWFLTTDIVAARHTLADLGGDEVALLKPADVVRERYGGVAMLATVG